MIGIKRHYLDTLPFLRTPEKSEKDMLFGITAHGILSLEGALVFALVPVIFMKKWGSVEVAGIIMMCFTLVEILLNPIAGALTDIKGPLKVLKFSVWFEFLGTLFWVFSGMEWGIYVFILGYFARWAFFLSSILVLSRAGKFAGGFWFGVRKEILAFSSFLGLLALPFFLIEANWPLLAFWTVSNNILAWFLLSRITPDTIRPKKFKLEEFLEVFNYWKILRSGFSFIKKNHRYPLFNLGNNIFEGFFFGSIWFLFPIHLAEMIKNSENTLILGIYELVTIFFAFLCGFVADRIDWRRLEIFSWIFAFALVWVLVFWHGVFSLLFLGFFLGLANNLFSASGYHALALFDDDHEEDGRYGAFAEIIRNIGFMLSPIICGFLYGKFGFQAGLVFIAGIVSILAIWMVFLAISLGENAKKLGVKKEKLLKMNKRNFR